MRGRYATRGSAWAAALSSFAILISLTSYPASCLLPPHPPHARAQINHLEMKFLELIDYDVSISSSLYASYYFQLRTLCQRENREPRATDETDVTDVTARSASARTVSHV